MDLVRHAEAKYVRERMRLVRHITLDPRGIGVVRVHMVPSTKYRRRSVPYLCLLNGQYILPIGVSWAIMLSCFIDRAEAVGKPDVTQDEWEELEKETVQDVKKIYPSMSASDLKNELNRLLSTLKQVASDGQAPKGMKPISLGEYAPYMTAPHRMDLAVSAMTKDGVWHCNQKCLHCYAAGQEGAGTPELTTDEWKKIIDKLKRANVPQLTFTGGEPTMREDLPELVRYAEWFVTRLNTNGRKLTPELCAELRDASLDNVQVTVYSCDKDVHNGLVGVDGFDDTVRGIENALAAGLGLSVNTPLCLQNRAYADTISYFAERGVKYFTCSALIPTGNALGEASVATRLSKEELKEVLTEAVAVCEKLGCEISFTSPGWFGAKEIRKMGLRDVPSCGACLSNMAVRPDGGVVPCQSWLSGEPLGNLKTDPWKTVWNSKTCRSIRAVSAKTEGKCQLNSETEEALCK